MTIYRPQKTPPPNEPLVWPKASNEVFPEDGWGFQGTCPRKSNNHANRGPSITKPREIWSSMIFPVVYCWSIMLPEINKKLDPGHPPIKWWEYLCWLGMANGHDH
jgi:hypothetical protein